ncbi:MAG: glutaminyl-peptide cyclotransferase [Planctomycetaceae bacterium]
MVSTHTPVLAQESADVRSTSAAVFRGRSVAVIVLILAAIAVGGSLMIPAAPAKTPVQTVTLVKAYPHDTAAFCQGLVMFHGQLLEGTGHYGHSRLRTVDLATGKPLVDLALSDQIFGEGVTVWKNTILQLTWQNGFLILYDAATLKETGRVKFSDIDPGLREGWGITHDGKHLIISDGSSTLRFVDPDTFRLVRRLRIKDGFRSVERLNELEFVNGEILANVWYLDQIARIDPQTGRVTSWLDIAPLRPAEVRRSREATLNGIAWDPQTQRLFVTGKYWPQLFEIKVNE